MTAVRTRPTAVPVAAVRAALDTVFDPELDEPITDLGFVRSVEVDVNGDGRVAIHLRLPTSFCSPNFAWIMAADARDAVGSLPGVTAVTVELDDHHDSDLINAGLAAGADYRTTFGAEAERDLEDLRATFRRKAHVAAMERVAAAWLAADPERTEADVAALALGDLPDDRLTSALLRRRAALALSTHPDAPVLVGEQGVPVAAADAAPLLRRARSVRISIDGNAHFCRGLLATRYPGAEADQAPRPDGGRNLLPLLISKGTPA